MINLQPSNLKRALMIFEQCSMAIAALLFISMIGCRAPSPEREFSNKTEQAPNWTSSEISSLWEIKDKSAIVKNPTDHFSGYWTVTGDDLFDKTRSNSEKEPDRVLLNNESLLTSAPAPTPWQMFQGDGRHSGDASDKPLEIPLLLKWRYFIGKEIFASPLVEDGRVYAAAVDGTIYALDFDTGAVLWSIRINSEIKGTPALVNGTLYVPAMDGNLYVIRADDGTIRFKRKTYLPSGPVSDALGLRSSAIANDLVIHEGSIYYAGDDGRLYQLELETKTVRSVTRLPGPVRKGGIAISGERLMVACASGDFACISIEADEPKILWNIRMTSPGLDAFRSPLSFVDDKVLIATGNDSFLLARHISDGHIVWAISLNGRVTGSVAIKGNTIFVPSQGKNGICHLSAVSSVSGEILWKSNLPATTIGTPIVVNGLIVVGIGGSKRCLAALDIHSGEFIWEANHFSSISTVPAPYDGHLIVATDSGYLASYEPAESLGINKMIPPGTSLPGPYVDWEGHATNFHWRFNRWPKYSVKISYLLKDFAFDFHPVDDAIPWFLMSRAMVPVEPFLLGPTYTGLLFPSKQNRDLRVVGVIGIDRPEETFYDLKIPDKKRALTALIVARKFQDKWRPIYVNNWFTSWRLNLSGALDPAIAGYYLDKKRPFNLFMRVTKETLPLLKTFDKSFISQAPRNPLIHGFLRTKRNGRGNQIELHHYWGQRSRKRPLKIHYGDSNQLMLLQLNQ